MKRAAGTRGREREKRDGRIEKGREKGEEGEGEKIKRGGRKGG